VIKIPELYSTADIKKGKIKQVECFECGKKGKIEDMLPHQKKYATIFYCQKCAKELREREKE
jgi:NAD-dependent SIR2 family protein deacetylase